MAVVRVSLEFDDKASAKVTQVSGQFKGLGAEGVKAGAAIGAGFMIAEKALELVLSLLKSIPAEIGRVVSSAAAFADLSAKTAMTAESLQKLKYAGSLVGVTLDEIAAASLKAQRNLVENPKAFEKWGLSVKALRDLRPEQQLAAIAEAIRGIPEPARQVAAAMDLMGKGGAANMALLRSDLHQVLQEADNLGVAMGDELVGKLDDVDDATTRLGASWTALKDKLIGGIVAATGADKVMTDLAMAIGAVNTKAQGGVVNNTLAAWVALVERVSGLGQIKQSIALLSLWNVGTPAVKGSKGLSGTPDQMAGGIMKDTIQLTEQLAKADDKAAAAARRHAEAARKATEARGVKELKEYSLAIADEFNRVMKAEGIHWKLGEALKAEARAAELAAAAAKDVSDAWDDAVAQVATAVVDDVRRQTEADTKAVQDHVDALQKQADKYGAVADAAASLADILGGTLGSALMGVAGVFDALSQAQAQAAQNLVNYGKEAATTAQKVQAVVAGIQAVYAAYQGGVASKSPGKGALRGAAGGAATGAMIGSVFPGIGTAAGAIVGGVVGGIAGWLGGKKGQADEIKALTAEFNALKRQAEAAGVAIRAGLNPRDAKALKAAIEEVNRALDTQAQAQEKLAAAVERYGFTIEELGPAMQRQQLEAMAGQLYEDWQLLNAAGIDNVAITERMGPAMSAYVQTAVAAGGEIPAAMKPIIDAMLAQGTLLDENGNAYGSAEDAGITYAKTMSQMFKELVDSVKLLVDALRGIPNTESTHTIRTVRTGGGAGEDAMPDPGDYDRSGPRDQGQAAGFFSPSLSSDRTFRAHRGERVEITPAAMRAARNRGEAGGSSRGVESRLDTLHADMRAALDSQRARDLALPAMLKSAVAIGKGMGGRAA